MCKIWSVDHKNAVKYTNQADEEASTTKSLSNIFLGHPVLCQIQLQLPLACNITRIVNGDQINFCEVTI